NNLLTDASIEGPWFQEAPGQWRTAVWGSYPAQTSPIFPDADASGGRCSCRIEGLGGDEVAYFSHATQPAPADENLRLTFYYRTKGLVEAKAIIVGAVALPVERVLALENSWKQVEIDFHTLPDSTGNVPFYL